MSYVSRVAVSQPKSYGMQAAFFEGLVGTPQCACVAGSPAECLLQGLARLPVMSTPSNWPEGASPASTHTHTCPDCCVSKDTRTRTHTCPCCYTLCLTTELNSLDKRLLLRKGWEFNVRSATVGVSAEARLNLVEDAAAGASNCGGAFRRVCVGGVLQPVRRVRISSAQCTRLAHLEHWLKCASRCLSVERAAKI